MNNLKTNRARIELCRHYIEAFGYKVSHDVLADGGQYEILAAGGVFVFAFKNCPEAVAVHGGIEDPESFSTIHVMSCGGSYDFVAENIKGMLSERLPFETFSLSLRKDK